MELKKGRFYRRCFLLMAIILSINIICGIAYADEEQSKTSVTTAQNTISSSSAPKAINLVYDDSGSMFKDNNDNYYDRWCQAKYAMQSFVAMLNTNDKMSIYTMSGNPEKLDLVNDGTNLQQLVNKVDTDINSMSLYTDFTPVTNAYNNLLSLSPEYEKWLVVLTDGTFNKGDGKDSVEAKLLEYAKGLQNKNGKVIYMAISKEAREFASRPNDGFYAYAAKESSDVLSKVTDMGNLVFNREKLPSDCYKYDKEKGVLSLELPMSMEKLTVFGQGGNISIGEIKNSTSILKKNSEIDLKYSELIPQSLPEYPIDRTKVVIDRTLMGKISNYGKEGEGTSFIPKGEYTLELKNAQEINIYYVYDFDIKMRLSYNGVEINDGENLSSGEYTYKVDIVDPSTGESLDVSLIKDLECSIEVNNNGEVKTYNDIEGVINLEKGNVQMLSTITADNSTTRTSSLTGYIYGDTKFGTDDDNKSIPIKELENEENAFSFVVTIDGVPLNPEQFATASLVAESDNKINYEIVKDDANGCFIVYPKYYEAGKYYTTDTGKVNMKLKCSYTDNGEKRIFSDLKEFNIEPVSLWERVIDFVLRNWWWLLLILVSVIIIILYSPLVKKRLPRGLNPCFVAHEYREADRVVSANTKVMNRFLPIVPDRMSIRSGSGDVDGVFFPEIVLEAVGRWNKRKAAIINTNSIKSSSAYEERMLDYGGTDFLEDNNGKRIPISLDDTITLSEKRVTSKSSRIDLKFKRIEQQQNDY